MQLPKLNSSNGVLWCKTGFRLEVQKVNGKNWRFLKIGDLNPEAKIYGSFTRLDTFRMGLFLIWRSMFAKTPSA